MKLLDDDFEFVFHLHEVGVLSVPRHADIFNRKQNLVYLFYRKNKLMSRKRGELRHFRDRQDHKVRSENAFRVSGLALKVVLCVGVESHTLG